MGLKSLLALLLLLNGCARHDLVNHAATSFAAQDIDGDGELSREEWERWYGTSAIHDRVLEFDWGDCNRNGRLDAHEYLEVRFKEKRCQVAPLESLRRNSGLATPQEGESSCLFNAKELHLASVSLVRTRQRLIDARFHEDYSEADMVPGTLYLYSLTCGGVEEIEIPEVSRDFERISRLGQLAPGRYQAVRCVASNQGERTVTYLRLRLTVQQVQGGAEIFHGKTLWIPPHASREFWILPDAGQPVTDVALLAVRVQAKN